MPRARHDDVLDDVGIPVLRRHWSSTLPWADAMYCPKCRCIRVLDDAVSDSTPCYFCFGAGWEAMLSASLGWRHVRSYCTTTELAGKIAAQQALRRQKHSG